MMFCVARNGLQQSLKKLSPWSSRISSTWPRRRRSRPRTWPSTSDVAVHFHLLRLLLRFEEFKQTQLLPSLAKSNWKPTTNWKKEHNRCLTRTPWLSLGRGRLWLSLGVSLPGISCLSPLGSTLFLYRFTNSACAWKPTSLSGKTLACVESASEF